MTPRALEKVFAKPDLLLSTASTRSARAAASRWRCAIILELIAELGVRDRTICVARHRLLHGVSADHGRGRHAGAARPRAVGRDGREARAARRFVFTMQGDGDMVSEGLQEVIHCAARGERFTAVVLEQRRSSARPAAT